jgi:RNA polymerase sigma-70 factor (ECF subfamily)
VAPVALAQDGAPIARPTPSRTPSQRQASERQLQELLPVLRAVARGMSVDPSEAEDLVHDTFDRALRAIDTLDPGVNPRGWVVMILHNVHIDRCRRRARMGRHVPIEEVPLAASEEQPEPWWSRIEPDELRQAVGELPDELRETYRLFALERRSYDDIVAALGIPKNTVGTRLSRARARLRAILGDKLRRGSP